MKESVTFSAPGKLMLFGEHSVVYGRPCIVTAVSQRLRASIQKLPQQILRLDAKDVKMERYEKSLSELGKGELPKGAAFVELAVRNFQAVHPLQFGIHIEITSEFSSQFGFGSSSATTVAVLAALSKLTGESLSSRAIFDLSYKTVIDVQKKGSGFDTAAATYGGTLLFTKGGEVLEQLKVTDLPLIIGYTGIKADTVQLIDKVLEKAKKYPDVIDGLYTSIGGLIDRARKAVENRDWQTVGELMNINQGYLEALGVSSGKLAAMIHTAREAGAWGAKLSGAGVGDCMIALASPEKRMAVVKAIESAGGQVIDIKANAEGTKIE